MATGSSALAAAACLPLLRFDTNPLNLRNPTTEAVSTFRDLMRDPETTPNTIQVLAPDLAAAQALAARLDAMPGGVRHPDARGFRAAATRRPSWR